MTFLRLNSPEARAGICTIIGVSLEGGVGQARELAEGSDYDYEPGGSVQVFGVRLVRGSPRSRTRAAAPVEGKWCQLQNWQWMEKRRKDDGRERDGGSEMEGAGVSHV